MGGAIGSPSTAYIYDWNMLPIGQALWLKELETYMAYPPLQDPASYNLDQVHAADQAGPRGPVAASSCGCAGVIRRSGRPDRAPANGMASKVIKQAARGPVGTSTSHFGFRCIKRTEPIASQRRGARHE